MNMEEIRKIDWRYLVSRKVETLLVYSLCESAYEYFEEATGILGNFQFRLRLRDGSYYYSSKELDALQRAIEEGGVKSLRDFRVRMIHYMSRLESIADTIEKTDCPQVSRAELVNLLGRFREEALYAYNFLLPMPVADKVLSKTILDLLPSGSDEEKQRLLGTLAYPVKENEHTKEEISFYKLAAAYRCQQPNFADLLQSHVKEFEWIGARGWDWEEAWSADDIIERLQTISEHSINPVKELEHLARLKKEVNRTGDELLEKIDTKNPHLLHGLVKLAREYAYLRTWRTDVIYRSGYRARNLFYEIARRAGYQDPEDVIYMTLEEVVQMAKTEATPLSIAELKRRKEGFVCVTMHGRFVVLSAKTHIQKLAKAIEEPLEATKEIKGNAAFHGKVQGLAKIVIETRDMRKVKKGDVLIAVMTFPHFISAMEKAKAFVTDEGGILCHAAIVAREMRKPCIIGTKIATKVLKDGDLVEVDADKGVVKILEKR